MTEYTELDGLWAEPDGVLYRLRQGELSESGAQLVVATLRRVSDLGATDVLPRRLVELVWYMPLFVSWQRERVEARGGDIHALERLLDECTNEVERILGVP